MLTAHPRTQPEAALDTDEWNDSLAGEFLWSNVNVSEAVPDVMTPSTWSLWRIFHYETNPIRFPGDYPFCGNICGRPYFNLSLLASVYRAVGRDARQELQADLIGSAPPDLDMPLLSFSPWRVYRTVFPGTLKARWLMRRCRQDMARFLAAMPDECRLTGTMIREARDPAALLLIWSRTLKPLIVRACEMLRTVTAELGGPATRLRQAFSRLVGETEANLLLSNLSGAAGGLASLGPITGLAQVVRGQMSRATYLERYGHRGPHEMELSAPGADDDPAWLDKQLAVFAQSVAAADALLEKQRAEQSAAWARLAARYPAKSPALRRELDRVAAAARNREAVRSEVTRAARLLRVFLLKAGDIAGLAEGVFFLTLAETTRTLAGDPSAGAHIPARRELYRKYCALPPYPAIIIGRFDPFVWAADPDRRSDLFDGRVSRPVAAAAAITGFPGAAGCVEGVVRRLACPEEGRWLQPGEILVAVTTNVGWTPLFPRAAAIVTDIGAPLSHAAIVARELGIPAVVGCGNATARLKTGDRVRVDGARGTVEVLERPTHQGYCVP